MIDSLVIFSIVLISHYVYVVFNVHNMSVETLIKHEMVTCILFCIIIVNLIILGLKHLF